MEFQDRVLTCVDCGAEFVWTAGEQQFFADKNFKNEPKRCKACKNKRANRPAGGGGGRERVETGVLQRVLPIAEVCRSRGRLTRSSWPVCRLFFTLSISKPDHTCATGAQV